MIKPGLVSITFRKLHPETIIALAMENTLAAIEWGGDIHVPHGNIAVARSVAKMTRIRYDIFRTIFPSVLVPDLRLHLKLSILNIHKSTYSLTG